MGVRIVRGLAVGVEGCLVGDCLEVAAEEVMGVQMIRGLMVGEDLGVEDSKLVVVAGEGAGAGEGVGEGGGGGRGR